MGPLPIYSEICLNGSVFAMRSGMMKAIGVLILPSASSIFGKGFLSTHLTVRSSVAVSSCWIALINRPIWSRAVQRSRLRHVPCQYRLAVMELQSRPQAERPGEPVGRGFLAFRHLALGLELLV